MTQFSSIIIGDESLTQHCAETLLSEGHSIAAVVTDNPDLSDWAAKRGLVVEAHGRDLGRRLGGISVDWVLSIANLKILGPDVLALGKKGAVNFHDGPLPKHAGLNAPVWAILNGETSHGVTWHLIDSGIDTGDILVQRSVSIASEDTALSLNTKCYEAALTSFPELLHELEHGLPGRTKQSTLGRSYHGLDKRPSVNGMIDLSGTVEAALNLVRALDHGSYVNPLCTAKLLTDVGVVHVGRAERVQSLAEAGQVIEVTADSVTVALSDGAIRCHDLRAASGKPFDPSKHISLGDALPSFAVDVREACNEALARVAKRDGFWRSTLKGAVPLVLPFATTGAQDIRTNATDIPSSHLAAGIAMLAQRLTSNDGTVIAHRAKDQVTTPVDSLISAWVPLTTVQLQKPLPDVSVGFACDLPLRDPDLTVMETPALGLSDAAGYIEGTALTFEDDGGKVEAHINLGRITADYADILIARVSWYATHLAQGKEPTALPAAELEAVLNGQNQTQVVLDGPETMQAAFEAQVAKTPETIALVHETREITFAELNQNANRVAHVLRDMGVEANTMVGLHCARGPDLLAGALGILKAGGAYLPLDPEYPQDRLAHYLTDSEASVVITQSNLQSELPQSNATVLVIDTDTRLKSADTSNPTAGSEAEDLAYVIYTSGSTGLPKGVMIEHRNVMNFYAGMDAVVGKEKDAAWLAVTSLSFDISVLELFYSMARGIKVVLPSTSQRGAISGGTSRRSGSGMDFSIYYWGNDDGAGRDKYRLLLEGAKFADQNGFCAVWTPERHFHAFGGPYPNPSVTGAAVAAVTEQIGVRAGSCVAPLHHPARIAEEWAVIDNLTNGRAGLAIASGWQPDDFVLRPENTPPENKPAMFDAIEQVRKLWRGEAVGFPRKDGQLHEVVTQPRPVSKELPIWVTTAGNPETWREAGRNGANVLTHLLGQSVEEVGEKIGLYRQALRDAGYNPDDFAVTLMLHTCLADTRDMAREIAREPMKDYLRSAAGLIKQYAWAFPAFKKPEGVKNAFELNLGDLSDDDLEGILDFAFERYFNDSGLFGTVNDALARVEQLKAIGVSEIACLIDYGIETDQVLEGLKPLAEVVKQSAPQRDHEETDFSIAAMLARHKITHLQCTPSMARIIAEDDDARAQLAGLKHILLGGEALPGALVNDIREATPASITNMYGPTETTIWSSTEAVTLEEATVNIGRPIANTQLYVLDDAQRPVGFGEVGELWIGGDGVTRGYWNRAEMTADRFRSNPFGLGRMYRTGDLVQRRPDGRLTFLGRADHQVKLRGFRIELGEIEAALQNITGIKNAVVVAREATPGDVRLVAYLTATQAVEPKTIRKALLDRLPDYMVPSHFVQLDEFPVTPNKKIDRNALPAPTTQPVKRDAPKPEVLQPDVQTDPRLQKGLAEIWSEVLGVSSIAPSDNFFDLGGHSLLAVQTHRAIRERLDCAKLSITDIFQFPTLEGLSGRVSALRGGSRAVPETSTVAEFKPTTATDRAKARSDAMARRRAMRARRQA